MVKEEDIQAAAVAILNARGFSQENIAELLGISSQSKVSRLLARSKDIVEFEPTPIWRIKPSDDELTQINAATFPERQEFERRIRELAQQRNLVEPTTINIVHCSTERKNDEFGRSAAKYAARFIEHSRYCAVAWGNTLNSLVSGLEKKRLKHELTFIPIAGQPLNSHEPGSSPSALAKNLSEKYGIPQKEQLSIQGVPARIPKDMASHEPTIKDFIEHCDHYCEIFGSRESPGTGLMNKVDMILSGIGDPATSQNDDWYKDIKKLEGGETLRVNARGNIAGLWLPRNRENQAHIEAVNEINKRSLGITQQQFTDCARQASQGDKPGVVVLAKEPQKTDIFLSTVGMVNHYILSKALVDEAIERLSTDTGTS